jgi:hypothetical protein
MAAPAKPREGLRRPTITSRVLAAPRVHPQRVITWRRTDIWSGFGHHFAQERVLSHLVGTDPCCWRQLGHGAGE